VTGWVGVKTESALPELALAVVKADAMWLANSATSGTDGVFGGSTTAVPPNPSAEATKVDAV
jgi:hypothetical protein